MTDAEKLTNSVDLYVGSRLRLQRLVLNLSQPTLADAIGVTFQQIQKYEKGINRIGASQLYTAAKALKVSVSFFFQGYDGACAHSQSQDGEAGNVVHFINSPDGAAFASALSSIHDSEVRKRLLELARTLASQLNSPSTD